MSSLHTDHDPDMFPHVSHLHIELLRANGAAEIEVPAGTVLFEEGELDCDFYVVLDGELEIHQRRGTATNVVVVHRSGHFVGDTHTLSGRAAVVRGVALTSCRLLQMTAAQLHHVVAEHSQLSDVILKAFLSRRAALLSRGLSSMRVIGSRHCSDTHRVREFLTRNSQPFTWLDLELESEVEQTLREMSVGIEELPVVLCPGGHVLRNPSTEEVARVLGMSSLPTCEVMDVLVVGAGPAGLAATVYAASEGLRVLLIDTAGPGGQAGTSSKIENYLGFPTGISGQDLAHLALVQAEKFGARIATARRAVRLDCEGPIYSVQLADGEVLKARAIVVATGAHYRKLEIANLADYEGKGVFYSATAMEGSLCRNACVAVVGAGNSAGQACVFLASVAREVHLVVRGVSLEASMSRYLIRRIEETPNIQLHVNTEVAALEGNGHLEAIDLVEKRTGHRQHVCASHLFSMVGAVPNSEWLCDALQLDSKGFVCTGRELTPDKLRWEAAREPFPFETSRPRIFAIGDVRSDSTKRVATSVGEGSAAVQFLHRALADLGEMVGAERCSR